MNSILSLKNQLIMKKVIVFAALAIILGPLRASAQSTMGKDTNLYIDVHHFGPGKVKYEDVAKAHAKDLAVEKKYGVDFIDFWVDENRGTVYCLSSTADSAS